MLKFVNVRTKPNEGFPPETREWTQLQALTRLLDNLGVFTTFSVVTPTRVVCKATVLNCDDLETFEGPEKEMHVIFLTSAFFTAFMSRNHKPSFEYGLTQLREFGYNKERLLGICDKVLQASTVGRACALLAIDIDPTPKLERLDNDTLAALITTHLETGLPFDQVVTELVA